jgi:flavin-dependent dehydrogenase
VADRQTEVAIVGGGPAGASLAARLAAEGREVVVFERRREPRWRASGVYTSPQTRPALIELGLPPYRVDELLRPVPELVVETVRGVECSLAHRAAGAAAGVDRVRLERTLLDHAKTAGAQVKEGAAVRAVRWRDRSGGKASELDVSEGREYVRWRARLVVGADGPSSLVARAAGVALGGVPISRAGITVHRHETRATDPTQPVAARLVFGEGWYLGATPVPGGRVNLGLVLTKRGLQERLARHGAPDAILRHIEAEIPRRARAGVVRWTASNADAVVLAYPLAHRVRRLAGDGFVLVGDAAGFIDPVSGEGIYRALSSAEHAAPAITGLFAGDRASLARYDAALRSRFARKDAISWFLQLLMSRPLLLDYAVGRLGTRDNARRTFGLVMSDLAPPERALDPRFLASLLMP